MDLERSRRTTRTASPETDASRATKVRRARRPFVELAPDGRERDEGQNRSAQRLKRVVDELGRSELARARRSARPEGSEDAIIGTALDDVITSWNSSAERDIAKYFFSRSNELLCVADFDGTFVLLNPAWGPTLGYSQAELLAMPFADFVHPEDRAATNAETLRLQSEHAVAGPFENRYRARDGTYRWLLWNSVPMSVERLIYATAHDITERKLAEAKIERVNQLLTEQNQRLAALMDQAHRFVDDVSHEFRTPLAVIKEFGAIIADGLAGPILPEQAEYLGIIDNAVLDLSLLVEDFLDSSKLRAGRLRVDRRPQRIDDIFARVRPGLQQKAVSRSITIVERFAADLPLVFADEEKVRRVIMNLVTNAVKFSPEGSRIELWARRAADGGVEIGVTDHGRGLSPDDLELVFERFRQSSNSDVESVKGFGLGLNIARQLVWLNLGSMNVVSDPGRGSTFSFTLPEADPRMILNRFFARLAEREQIAPSVAVLQVTLEEPTESIDDLRLLLTATTRPTDVILDLPSTQGYGLLVFGPTQSAEGWMSRLSRAHDHAIAEAGAAKHGNIFVKMLGSFDYPDGASDATACALEHLVQDAAVA